MPLRSEDLSRLIKTVSTLRQVWFLALLVGLYSLIAVGIAYSPVANYLEFQSQIVTFFSVVLSIILVFRTNRAYDRWWEARTLWGKLVNVSRNLAIKSLRLGNPDSDERTYLHRLIAGFAFALKDHLREGATLETVPGWIGADATPVHVPAWLSSQTYELFVEWKGDGRIDGNDLIVLDRDAREFLEVCGGCERIRNTPIAGSYRAFSIKSLSVYLLALPWGLAHDLGFVTVPICMIIAYVMVGLEAIADHVEQPFGYDLDDLDLERLCKVIDTTTAELLNVDTLYPATTSTPPVRL